MEPVGKAVVERVVTKARRGVRRQLVLTIGVLGVGGALIAGYGHEQRLHP
jgi:hypothetical protein